MRSLSNNSYGELIIINDRNSRIIPIDWLYFCQAKLLYGIKEKAVIAWCSYPVTIPSNDIMQIGG